MMLRIPWWLPVGKTAEINPATLKAWLENGRGLQIVDARTTLEYQQGTIGSARSAPVIGMPNSVAALDLDLKKPVVLICLSGHRSLPGTRWLRARGFEAYSLQGGVLAWRQAGYSLNDPDIED